MNGRCRVSFRAPSDLLRSSDVPVRRFMHKRSELVQQAASNQIGIDVSRDENPRQRPFIDKLEGGEEDTAALMANLKGLCPNSDLPSHNGFD